jgi:hypothetical protein
MTHDDDTAPTTDAVPDFAAWSKILSGIAEDLADGDGVSEEQTRALRGIADWCEERANWRRCGDWFNEQSKRAEVDDILEPYKVEHPPRETLRDRIAMAALPAVTPTALGEEIDPADRNHTVLLGMMAGAAYILADAMLAAREAKTP